MKYLPTTITVILCGVALCSPFDAAKGEPSSSVDRVQPPRQAHPAPTLSEARRQAEILHTAIHSSLRVVHDRYYQLDEGLPIPAAIMKEVFRDLEQQQQVQLRWLAVEGQAMNTDHRPRDAFEKLAVAKLKAKQPFHESLQGTTYRRAAPITLSNHCLKCHVPDRKDLRDHTAGLIIQITIQKPRAGSQAAK